ncbi:MAG: substrate-binding domain-containing protein [Phycisphaeraceae bacterium]
MNDPVKAPNGSKRVAVMLEMTWPLRRHIDVFAGITRYAAEQADWACVVDDFADHSITEGKGKPIYQGVIARVTPALVTAAARRKLPLVNVWFSSPVRRVPSVFPDFAAGGQLVAEHLEHRGVRQVLCLIRRGDRGEQMTADTIMRHFHTQGDHCRIERVSPRFAHTRENWIATHKLLADCLHSMSPPVGIYAGDDILCRMVAQACGDMGLSIPRDIALVAGDNEPALCLYPEPSLTSVDVGFERVGFEAARMMDQLLAGGPKPTKPLLIPPRELVVRNSSDFLYVDDPPVSAAMQFIAANSRERISVEHVAEAAGVSRRSLELRFRSHLNRSVAGELQRVRVEHARRLLVGSEFSIGAIAKRVGYGTNSQLTRVFQREFGLTPRAYRQKFEKE